MMAKAFNVDFKGVSSGNGVAQGTYQATVKSIAKDKKEGGEYPYLRWEFELAGTTISHITSLSPTALFGLKNVMEALGLKVPDGQMKIEPDALIGRVCEVDVMDKEYNGNTYSNIVKLRKITGSSVTPVSTEKIEAPSNIEDVL